MILAGLVISNNPESTTMVNERLRRTATVKPRADHFSIKFEETPNVPITRHAYRTAEAAERVALDFVLGHRGLNDIFKY